MLFSLIVFWFRVRKVKSVSIDSLVKQRKYELKDEKFTALQGKWLRVIVWILENTFLKNVLIPFMLKMKGVGILDRIRFSGSGVQFPVPFSFWSREKLDEKKLEERRKNAVKKLSDMMKPDELYQTSRDFYEAYLSGKTTPTIVANQIIAFYKSYNKQYCHIIEFNEKILLEQAEASSNRYKNKAPLSPLDGVPVAIKDTTDLKGFATKKGTIIPQFQKPVPVDSIVCERLRSFGCLFIGKTGMSEIGIEPRSLNPHYGYCRNPFNPSYETGGSSSGSAGLTSANLSPISIGTDGGGSVRIPASFCGVYGIKPTHHAVPEMEFHPSCAASVGVTGPIASTAYDLAMAYIAISGGDTRDLESLRNPCQDFQAFLPTKKDLKGVKLGFFKEYFNHCETEISNQCNKFLSDVLVKKLSAEKKDIFIPALNELRVSHLVTIATEMKSGYQTESMEHGDKFLPVTRMTFLGNEYMKARDFVNAQKMKQEGLKIFEKLFEEVDYIVLPTTARTAATLPSDPRFGESDYTKQDQYMRYCFASNLLGFPSVTIPIGYDKNGLPIGFQILGKWYDEAGLIQFCYLTEEFCQNGRKKPVLFNEFKFSKEISPTPIKELPKASKEKKDIDKTKVEDKGKVETKIAQAEDKVETKIAQVPEVKEISKSAPSQKMEIRRGYILAELLETERFYCHGLTVLRNRFYKALMDQKIVSKDMAKQIFSDLEMVYGTSQHFLQQLEKVYMVESEGVISELAKLMKSSFHLFKLYSGYIQNYTNAVNTIDTLEKKNSKFKKFLENVTSSLQKDGEKITNVRSLLITPIQRIPRYRLLLQDLLKVLDDSTEQYKDLTNAKNSIDDLAKYCNEKARSAGNNVRLLELDNSLNIRDLVQPHRKFLAESLCLRLSKRPVKSVAYLLNDLLILVDQEVNPLASFRNSIRIANKSNRVIPLLPETIVTQIDECKLQFVSMKPNKHTTTILQFEDQKTPSEWFSIIKEHQGLLEDETK